jgi:hypothetical protein
VWFNEVQQLVWKAEADGLPENFDVLLATDDPYLRGPNHLWRSAGWAATSWKNPYPVKIDTLTAGFDKPDAPTLNPIPEDLKEAAFLLVQKFFRDQTRQLAEVATVTTPDGSLSMFDTSIPKRAMEILNSYQRKTLA